MIAKRMRLHFSSKRQRPQKVQDPSRIFKSMLLRHLPGILLYPLKIGKWCENRASTSQKSRIKPAQQVLILMVTYTGEAIDAIIKVQGSCQPRNRNPKGQGGLKRPWSVVDVGDNDEIENSIANKPYQKTERKRKTLRLMKRSRQKWVWRRSK